MLRFHLHCTGREVSVPLSLVMIGFIDFPCFVLECHWVRTCRTQCRMRAREHSCRCLPGSPAAACVRVLLPVSVSANEARAMALHRVVYIVLGVWPVFLLITLSLCAVDQHTRLVLDFIFCFCCGVHVGSVGSGRRHDSLQLRVANQSRIPPTTLAVFCLLFSTADFAKNVYKIRKVKWRVPRHDLTALRAVLLAACTAASNGDGVTAYSPVSPRARVSDAILCLCPIQALMADEEGWLRKKEWCKGVWSSLVGDGSTSASPQPKAEQDGSSSGSDEVGSTERGPDSQDAVVVDNQVHAVHAIASGEQPWLLFPVCAYFFHPARC